MLNSDSHFLIGHTHYICEDYALSGIGKNGLFHYAIVADGCSASEDVDIGARILAKCAIDSLNTFYPFAMSPRELYDIIGETTIKKAQKVVNKLGLSDHSLDATLLIALAAEEKNCVLVYGDGVVLFRNSYATVIYEVEFPSGAPYYLSYLLDGDRRNTYFLHGDHYDLTDWIKGVSHKISHDIIDSPPFFGATAPPTHDIVAVMSDGVGTYRDNISSMDFMKSVSELTDFKNTNGLFVKRRMNALKRKNDRLDIVHDDDVSVAAIYWEQ